MIFLRSLRTAIRFLTRVPLPGSHELRGNEYVWSLAWYPVIGAGIGLTLGWVATTSNQFLPLELSILMGLIFISILTGGLHEDGLADTCDALGGGWTKEKRLEIMKDSRIGSYGSMALILLYFCRFFCMATTAPSKWILYSIYAHSISRWPVLILLKIMPSARTTQGLSIELSQQLSWRIIGVGTLMLGLIVWGLNVPLLMLVLSLLMTFVLGALYQNKVGGITGDLCGCTVCVIEIVCWFLLASKEHLYIQ
ncbi:MAG: adenosylcobinamide-GDP ribazoletransferase [Proteobacteria bacterium]|nr:adenosylcobinamide-GDP ribazoletransferase [Pseudomonadota bacterium]